MSNAFPAMDKASLEPVNILVVDDLPDKLLAMKTVLEDLGENLVCVQSGREALRRVIDQDFAVILLDVNMPDMDGLETAQLIRQREKSRATPIIFITAFADDVDEVSVYSMGAVDYMMSPVVPQILRSKVGVFVELHRKRELIKRQADERVQLAHEQAARASAEEAERRAAFLANAGALVARSLDLDETLSSLARVMVPELGREGVVHLLAEGRTPSKTIRSRALPDGTFAVDILAGGLDELDPPLVELIQRAVSAGRAEMSPDNNKTGVPRSTLVVPVGLRGKVFGALAFPRPKGAHGFRLEDRGVAEDLAARVAHAIENARLFEDIRERDVRKNEFLAMLAHELRAPLAPIATAVELLRLAKDPHKVASARDVISRQARQMSRQVDHQHDLARITSGKVRLEMQPVELQSVVANAVETTRPLIEARRQVLTVDVPERALSVQGDQVRLGQVLANLINNACKYTDEGGTIQVRVEERGEQLEVSIIDSGVGISAEMLPVVFDLFTQADRSLDHSQGGLGIGLTVVRRLVEIHGGQVEARSEGVGKGSQFIVRLPRLERTTEPELPPDPVRVGSAASSAARILVVDDNVDAAELLAELLRMVGHDVSVAYDGPTGLAEVERVAPDFTLLDIGLPGLNGYEVARRIRAHRRHDNMVLVAITGYGQDSDMLQAKDVGFDHHLVKPVSPETLLQILARSAGRSPVSIRAAHAGTE